ncbi:hypothetical protein ABMA27_004612 [Loxostege sticticalis]|uniref:Sorting nexin-14-like n=1 Tax=Loxostege sticticalis TaxID=481309 RepID=A0ABR3HP74_LOXSC
MTERCQTKFTEKFDNQNYIIYVGVISASLAVLYFYRFHFIAIALSYVLGCVACYYGLNSSVFRDYVRLLKSHFTGNAGEALEDDVPDKGCITCGSPDCTRHDSSPPAEPWVGLQIHKQLDQAIEDFYNSILEQFISSWYSKITLQPFFVDELRHQLRFASECLLRRAVKINFSRFITGRLVPCALRHYCVCARGTRLAPHPAAASRRQELQYLRGVARAVMPYLLRPDEADNPVFRVLIREIFAGWVLLSLTDVLADPYILNTLIVLATGDETMAQLPTTPNYKVEFLERFARHTESVYVQRPKLLRVDLEWVIGDQEYFYAFMQHLKATSHIHLLQFYKDIKLFQTKLLNPELGAGERASLHREACDIYELYLSPRSLSRVPLDATIAAEMKEILHADDSIKRLQTSRALYQAARQSHAILEKIMLPKFLHSEEYYKLVIGSRIPTGYQKQMTKKPQERLLQTALKLGNRLKGALRPQTIDGQVLESFANSEEDGDGGENMDILKYLESLANEDSLREQDLRTYKVVLTNVETRLQAPPRRGTVRVFTLAVHRIDNGSGARLWTLERSEHDFHLLRSKLHEFHGDKLLHELALPSRRDNSPMETLRYKYEDFLQRLLQKSLLQTSELLHLFLTVDGDFSMVVQASTLNANSSDLANIYQSVTHKLRKEKGQHLESFLRNLLVSSDIDRYQALKQGTARDVEEAQEVSEEAIPQERARHARDISDSVFRDNLGLPPHACYAGDKEHQAAVTGFTQCAMFLLVKVVKARGFVTAIAGSVFCLTRELVDDAFDALLNRVLCRLLSERRLAHLIRLGHGLLFGKKPTPRADPVRQRELARAQLLQSIPSPVVLIAGTGLPVAVHKAFELIQRPQLNKQLVYNLLDLCLMELFPELGASNEPSKEPKS